MSNLCINCSNLIDEKYCSVCLQAEPLQKEFCNECCSKLIISADAEFRETNPNIVDTRSHVLFQTKNVTGRILEGEDDLIANRLQSDPEGTSDYWLNVLFLVFLMMLIIVTVQIFD